MAQISYDFIHVWDLQEVSQDTVPQQHPIFCASIQNTKGSKATKRI